jgi:DNA-directed RNA polymerase I, II, and III subunit RPABC2
MRANQIAANSPLYIEIPFDSIRGLSAIDIAELEFKEKKLPYIIRRILPNGRYEDWSLSELQSKLI